MTIKTLDSNFSKFIRLRDSDDNGYCTCITCGKVEFWKDVDCGHYVNRRHYALRWSEVNTAAQCRYCNRFNEGELGRFRVALVQQLGEDKVKVMDYTRGGKKPAPFELKALNDHYKKEVKNLLKEKLL